MSSLFTISSSWHKTVPVFEALAFARPGDTVLLMEDAVLALQSPINLASFEGKCAAQKITVCALQSDCALRGVDSKYDSIMLIDYAEFVALVLKHDKQVAW